MFTREQLESAGSLVHSVFGPTGQYAWPLLNERTGAQVWVKHENHTPTGAFKVRGGLVYLDDFKRSRSCDMSGLISATRNNHGQSLAEQRGLEMIPPFHPLLVRGVATHALELFHALPDLDTVYAPIGVGSGISGLVKTRDLLGLKTRIVGVVSEHASAYSLSFEAGHPVQTETALTFADGMACRTPMQEALSIIHAGAERIFRAAMSIRNCLRPC